MTQEYLVSHGKSGAVGRFAADGMPLLRRSDRVVVRGWRGLELATILCPASERQRRLLATTPLGQLLRRADGDDERLAAEQRALADKVAAAASLFSRQASLPVQILDAEVLLDGAHAYLQCLTAEDTNAGSLIGEIETQFDLTVLLENLAALPPAEDQGGCDKPDCGRQAGGCSTCGDGGGCSSCGSKKLDLRDYFAHLRTKMEDHQRTSLL